jgi:uncharacterized protein YdaU (DUF1376 family)
MMNAWYPHYPGDYGRDTAHLSLVQHGAYRLLLDHYYATAAPLPSEVTAIYRICRAFDDVERNAASFVLEEFFELSADGYHNRRADAELQKRSECRQKLSQAGKKRWEQPRHKPGSSQAIASPQPQPQPQEKQTSSAAKTAAEHAGFPEFEIFYEAYPLRRGRAEARAAWMRKGCEGHLGEILASLRAWKENVWPGQERLPYAATWLNKERFKESPVGEERKVPNAKSGFDPVATATAFGFGKPGNPN